VLGENVVKQFFFGYRSRLWEGRIRLFGTPAFLKRTVQALHLLKSAGYSHLVLANLSDIRQGLRSTGYISTQGRPVYRAGAFSWGLSHAGYASMIAHHAYRHQLGTCQTLPAAIDIEVNCLLFQEDFLRRIVASDADINDALGLAKSEVRQMVVDQARIKAKQELAKSRGVLRSVVPFAFAKFRTATHLGVQIRGSQQFIAKCEASLDLLKQLQYGEIVFDNIARIKESQGPTRIRTSLTKPVVSICWPLKLKVSPESLAGTLAHEAYHNHLHREAVKHGKKASFNSPTAASDERSCIDFQIRILRVIGGCEIEASVLETMTHFPTNIGKYNNMFDYIWRVLRFRG
jgi:hypothetical protein